MPETPSQEPSIDQFSAAIIAQYAPNAHVWCYGGPEIINLTINCTPAPLSHDTALMLLSVLCDHTDWLPCTVHYQYRDDQIQVAVLNLVTTGPMMARMHADAADPIVARAGECWCTHVAAEHTVVGECLAGGCPCDDFETMP